MIVQYVGFGENLGDGEFKVEVRWCMYTLEKLTCPPENQWLEDVSYISPF